MEILNQESSITLFLEVALSILSMVFIYYKLKRWDLEKHAEKFPGEPTLPFVGNALMLRRVQRQTDLVILMEEFVQKYEEHGIMKFWMGPKLVLLVWDPSYIESVSNSLMTAAKGEFYDLVLSEVARGVVVSDGKVWKELRKPLNKSFAKKYLDNDYFEVFLKKSRKIREYLNENREGKYADIKDDIGAITLETILETHNGIDMDELNSRTCNYTSLIDEYVDITATSLIKYTFIGWGNVKRFTNLGKRIRELHNVRNFVFEKFFEERKKNKIKNRDNLEFYIDYLVRRGEKKNLSTDHIYKELMDVLVAGADTSNIMLSSAILYLAMFPECQEEAYRELEGIFGTSDRDPTLEDLPRMMYLERVLKESMRIHTPPVIPKYSEGDLNLGKYTIPKGCDIVIFTRHVHHDPKYWERPHSFYPDHFLPEKEKDRPRYAYIPFGCGPRSCPGLHFAMMSMLVTLSTILRTFKVTTQIKFEDIEYEHKLMIIISNGCKVKLTRR